jgi:Asp-tRNA(Asn)/Glu-tRNA(Gln) amidotransferase A subunit family amidase
VALPNGFTENGTPVSITFIGGLHDEATLLSVAKMYQDALNFISSIRRFLRSECSI